jgi:zinc and cadmium transporter
MSLFVFIILFTALGGVLSVIIAALVLLLPDGHRNQLLPHGISFATGALLAVAFWGLIPEAFEAVKPVEFQNLSGTILAGLLGFFILEKVLVWRHCHSDKCVAHSEENVHGHSHSVKVSTGALIIIGDSIHNFVDGVLIGAAFLTDIKLGIVTSIAVATHEIPQEVGDFVILLESGYSKKKALSYNVLSSMTTVIGGMLAYFCLENLHQTLPYFLVLAASSFIYIAVSDLIPTLHKKTDIKSSVEQIILIVAGMLLICTLHEIAHDV